jgi:hypothetical protein
LGYFKGSIDVTFSASLLASTASTYGLTMNRTGKKKEEKSVIVDNKDTKAGIK